ncbi:hypothetical protein IFM89_017911 [Coptis chinensis]|uniref:Uncharacterized protein n=1 Tax=Coptis chinensis TaxID=261450 RepID=A0A835IVX1_9MAGN|nr:hypothetical protein IFM89_017911 [Coptis chinensis]
MFARKPLMFFTAAHVRQRLEISAAPRVRHQLPLDQEHPHAHGIIATKASILLKCNNQKVSQGHRLSEFHAKCHLRAFADEIGIPFMETSAKSSTNSYLALRYEALILREKIRG